MPRPYVDATSVFVPASGLKSCSAVTGASGRNPDTPGPGYWEINIATLLEKTRSQRRVEVPRIDLNYGVGRRIQLKFEMPWVVFQNEEQRTETGSGNATLGVKWRFTGQEGEKVGGAARAPEEREAEAAAEVAAEQAAGNEDDDGSPPDGDPGAE